MDLKFDRICRLTLGCRDEIARRALEASDALHAPGRRSCDTPPTDSPARSRTGRPGWRPTAGLEGGSTRLPLPSARRDCRCRWAARSAH
jgi:hypothetical protein